MSGEISEEMPEVVIAAKWWGDQLRNSDDSQLVLINWSRENSNRPSPEIFAEMADLFEHFLKREIVERLREIKFPESPLCITVDYEPDKLLCTALRYAGFPILRYLLPVKSQVTLIRSGLVTASLGYGGDDETIYITEEAKHYLVQKAIEQIKLGVSRLGEARRCYIRHISNEITDNLLRIDVNLGRIIAVLRIWEESENIGQMADNVYYRL